MIVLAAGSSDAGTGGGIYDMSRLLNQPHPFATAQSAPRPFSDGRTVRPPANPQSDAPLAPGKTPAKPLDLNSASNSGNGDIISEIRVGALLHDFGPFSHRKESGYDGNLEILFNSPEVLKKIWAPRPHAGFSVNSDNDTNQAYLGLTWEWGFLSNAFFNFSLGGAYHDGYKRTDLTDKKSLGCKILFRESLDIGFRLNEVHSLMFHLDHISNAKLCSTNEGLEAIGIRYGYKF
ncbi:MAG: acyloxyacyl hydrolase [Rhodospirillaceae bacterium]|nr:acyloxyacyl hydrolase [Rhodospirillaceae bacterium]